MGNDLRKTSTSSLPVSGTEINQQAQKIYNVQHADKVTTGNINTTIILNPSQKGSPSASSTAGKSRDFYNLFVLGGEEFSGFEKGHFTIMKERALTEYMSPDIKDFVDSLSSEAIELIKTFPAIFCSENDQYGTCADSQIAYLGLVTDIKVQDNGIKVYYQTLYDLPQKRLNEIIFDLGISGTDSFNEFNRTHWCIKRIDLIAALQEAGIQFGFF